MSFISRLALAATFVGVVAAVSGPALAGCKRMGFTVNDYGKDGPTNDAKDLLDKHISNWAAEQGIEKYSVGKKDVNCELFLNLIVVDEHTCTASATVCWGNDKAPQEQDAKAVTKPKTPKAETAKVETTKSDTGKDAASDKVTAEKASDEKAAKKDTAESEGKSEKKAAAVETKSSATVEPKAEKQADSKPSDKATEPEKSAEAKPVAPVTEETSLEHKSAKA